MTSASDHTRALLAAIIPDRRDFLELALRDLTPKHLPDRILANLFTMLERYYEVTGAVLTRDALGDLLAGGRVDAGTTAAYQELYDELHDRKADEPTFRWALQQIREMAADRATNEALTTGMEILTRGVEGERGELLRGHQDARTHVLTRFADIDRGLAMQDAPEGDMRSEGEQILAEYQQRQAERLQGRGTGINFGVPPLDDKLGGTHDGELILVAGYTSDGKTSMCVQLAWSAAVQQNKNVLFFTTETIRSQVRRRLIARHSCLSQFGLRDGLNSRDIKDGTLDAQELAVLEQVVNDCQHNEDYGRIYICQVPRGATMTYVETKAARIARDMPTDLLIVDYLALLRAERKRVTDREELSSILKSAKQLSTTMNDGRGVALVSPWQVSRTARVEAERLGYYTLAALSETAETSNSADTIISLLAPLDNESRWSKVKTQIMKHRDGEKANSIELSVDYATSKFSGAAQVGTTIDTMFDPLNAFL